MVTARCTTGPGESTTYREPFFSIMDNIVNKGLELLEAVLRRIFKDS